MAKVAVASSDGVWINEHFGHAESFLVYEVQESGEFELLERRITIPDGEVSEDHGRASRSAELLADVNAVLVKQIGKHASALLEGKGIHVYSLNLSIFKALQTFGKKQKLIQNLATGCGGCSSKGGCGSGCK